MLSEGKLEELKPCPFCGDDQSSFAGNCEGAFARCSDGTLSVNCDCGVTGPAGADGLAAIRAWNTRAQAPAGFSGDEPSRAKSGEAQPIETAPRDGRWIIGWQKNFKPVPTRWHPASGRGGVGPGWWGCDPTHWVSFPEEAVFDEEQRG